MSRSSAFARLVFAVLTVVVLVGCPPPPPATARWEPVGGVEPTRTTSGGAAFDAAAAQYARGDYAAAVDAFRLFGVEHPGDPRAVLAEIYIARGQAALGNTLEAEAAFVSLRDAPVDPDSWAAAGLYVAFVAALRGENERGEAGLHDMLAEDPALRVPLAWVVPGDEALIGALLAEARVSRGDALGALEDLAVVYTFGDAQLAEYALDRGAELAASSDDRRALRRIYEGEDAFSVAAVSAPLARLLIDVGDAAAAREVLVRGATAAAIAGRPERIEEVLAGLPTDADEVGARYGAALPLTGPNRRAGRAALGAMLLAQRAFSDWSATSVLLVRDTQGTEEGTRLAVQDLIASGVSVIVGPIDAELGAVAVDVARRSQTPVVSLAPLTDPVAGSYQWLLDPRAEARAGLDEAVARGASRIVIVREPDAAPFFDEFAAEARVVAGSHMEQVWLERADDAAQTQENARSAARSIARTDADAVVLALPDDLAATLVAHLAAEDVWPSADGATRSPTGRRQVTYVANSFLITADTLRNSAAYLRGAIIPYWFDVELAEGAARVFADRFVATFGRAPGVMEAFAFDAATAVRRVLVDEHVRSPIDVAERLAVGVEIDGVVGPLRFDETGRAVATPRLCTVRGERFAVP